MPKSSEPTDGNTSQWDKLKQMRGSRDAATVAKEVEVSGATAEEIAAETARLKAGEPIGGNQPDPDPVVDESDDGDDDTDETVQVAAHERTKPGAKTETTIAPPGTEAIEMDGKTVYVDPSLAQAFRESQEYAATTAAEAAHQKIVDDVTARVTAGLPPAKSAAEIAADAALADAEKHPPVPMPPGDLAVTDPDAYSKQLQAHIDDKTQRAAKAAIAEKEARDAATARATELTTVAQREAFAREQLGIQFYAKYPVLTAPETKALVDILLEKKWAEVAGKLKTNPPKTPAEGEAMKHREFADVAAQATRQIVAIRGSGSAGAKVSPPPPPPNVATSRTPAPGKTPKAPEAKPKSKFPEGSMSSILKAHQAKKSGAVA